MHLNMFSSFCLICFSLHVLWILWCGTTFFKLSGECFKNKILKSKGIWIDYAIFWKRAQQLVAKRQQRLSQSYSIIQTTDQIIISSNKANNVASFRDKPSIWNRKWSFCSPVLLLDDASKRPLIPHVRELILFIYDPIVIFPDPPSFDTTKNSYTIPDVPVFHQYLNAACIWGFVQR